MESKTLSRILFVNACFSLSRTGACKQLSARTIRHSDQDVHEVSRSWARRRVFLHVSGAPRLKKEKSGGLFFCFSLALALSLSSLSSLVARVSPSIAFSLSDKPRNAGLSFLAELSLPSAVERSTRPLCQVRGDSFFDAFPLPHEKEISRRSILTFSKPERHNSSLSFHFLSTKNVSR